VTIAPLGKIGDVEVSVGANGVMLLAIALMQLMGLVRWMAKVFFDTSKKREEARDKLMSSMAESIQSLSRDIHIMKHTMLTDEDVLKSVQLEVYKMTHVKGKNT